MTENGLCARCYDEAPTYPATCAERPELLVGLPIGQYHCPDCGAMVLAGLPHPELCKPCLTHTHPSYDRSE